MEDLLITQADIEHRTDEQALLIKHVLEEVKPALCEVVGDDVVYAVAKGLPIEAPSGGRNLSNVELVSVLSNIAMISQVVVLAAWGLKKLMGGETNALLMEARKAVLRRVMEDPKLKDLSDVIANDPEILDRIVKKVVGPDSNLV